MTEPTHDEYRVRADTLRLLTAFASEDTDDNVTALLDEVIAHGDVRKVVLYLLGMAYGLFVCGYGNEATKAIIARELAVAEEIGEL